MKFPTERGYIRVRLPDPAEKDPMDRQSIRTIALCGEAIVLADKWTGKVYKYDKTSGKPLGAFVVKEPACIAVDEDRRLWIAYDACKVGVFDLDGKPLGQVAVQAAEIVTIRLVGDQALGGRRPDRDYRLQNEGTGQGRAGQDLRPQGSVWRV